MVVTAYHNKPLNFSGATLWIGKKPYFPLPQNERWVSRETLPYLIWKADHDHWWLHVINWNESELSSLFSWTGLNVNYFLYPFSESKMNLITKLLDYYIFISLTVLTKISMISVNNEIIVEQLHWWKLNDRNVLRWVHC